MAYEGLKDNTNAEKWTIETATEFFNECIELSRNKEYDFIGEIARDMGTYKDVYKHILGRFPELKGLSNILHTNCEANCYANGKKQKIAPSMAIMNLKSNHGWTDRVDNTNTIRDERKGIDSLFPEEEELNGEED